MVPNNSVMDYDEDTSSQIPFEERMYREYQEAVANGFQGTMEEYYRTRDYT